jgi:hypothetical protein
MVAVAFVLELVLVILKIPIFAQWLGSTHGGLHVLTEKFSQLPEVTASDPFHHPDRTLLVRARLGYGRFLDQLDSLGSFHWGCWF